MVKNITILLFGILFGGTVTVLVAHYYYTTYFSKPTLLITPETADYLNTFGAPTNNKIVNINSLTFRQAPIITQSTRSASVVQSFNIIQTNFSEITKSNNSIIYEDLLLLKEKAIKTEWGGIFDLITEIKVEIEQNLSRISEINTELAKLEVSNIPEYADYIEKSHALIAAITEYFNALETILIGKIPSKEDTILVNSKVGDMSNAYWEYDTATNDFLKII
ncbi:MAG: hypothetical protein K9M11_00570 [Candidatus Pacebacteria bacterium]|nr:hypothetical protein [Candidatus Paceibacterota bacterium]